MTKEASSTERALKLALEALLPKAIWNESIEGVFDVPLNEAAHAVVAIRKALTDLPEPVQHTYASKQATKCAGCGEHKHTPLRIDAMGGYVCLTCIDRKLGSLLGEFGYPKPEQPAQQQEPRKPQQRSTEHPVAYAVYHRMGGGKSLHWSEQHSEDGDHNEYQLVPLYTSPTASQSRSDVKPLPDFSPIFSGIKGQ